MIMMIGKPSEDMIRRCKKRNKFFDKNGQYIKSNESRLEGIVHERSYPLKKALRMVEDDDLEDFIEKCLFLDPETRWSPEEAL